jgi:hypothetical protein
MGMNMKTLKQITLEHRIVNTEMLIKVLNDVAMKRAKQGYNSLTYKIDMPINKDVIEESFVDKVDKIVITADNIDHGHTIKMFW